MSLLTSDFWIFVLYHWSCFVLKL